MLLLLSTYLWITGGLSNVAVAEERAGGAFPLGGRVLLVLGWPLITLHATVSLLISGEEVE